MAQATSTVAVTTSHRRRGRGGLRVSGALALWRLRRTWRLVLLAELGMLAAVALVCAVPLFARVAAVAGLEHTLNHYPNAHVFTASFSTNEPTTAHMREALTRFRPAIDRYFGPFGVGDVSEFSMTSQPTSFQASSSTSSGDALMLWATTNDVQASQLRLIAGHLPSPAAGSQVEVAVSQATLDALGLQLGDPLVIGPPGNPNAAVTLRVVGVVERITPAVYPDPELAPTPRNGPSGAGNQYVAMASSDAIASLSVNWAALVDAEQYKGPPDQRPTFWHLSWIYPASLSHLDQINTDDLGQYQYNRYLAFSSFGDIPWMSQVMLWSDAPDVLYAYGQRILLAQIASTLLLLGAFGLVLLFLSQSAQMLIEDQAEQVATLRSRGANRRQIFRAFALQSLGMGAVALLAGPLIALALVRVVTVVLLPVESGHALAALDGGPLALLARIWIVALIAVVVAVAALLLAVGRASRLSMPALRQELARGGGKPLWQRLYLDVIAAVFALSGYGVFALSTQLASADASRSAFNLRMGLAPLSFVAPIFLMVAATLLFLRFVPLGLRLAGRFAARGRGATATLAFTQLARATRPALRMTILLALTTCFAVFTLNAQATALQRTRDLADFQAGADISGGLVAPAEPGAEGLSSRTAAYDAVPGILATSLGYRTSTPTERRTPGPYKFADGDGSVIQIAAVDTSTFASAALWSTDYSRQSLDQLTTLLRTQQASAITGNVVPAIVDAEAWSILRLHTGATFTLPTPGYAIGDMRFIAAERVERIPTMFNIHVSGPDAGTGAILVDYATFAAVYAHETGDVTGTDIAPNFAWLRTQDDPAALASARAALDSGPLQLGPLQVASAPNIARADRRAMIADFASDPIYLSLTGTLGIEAAAALALALLGTVMAARLWLRGQLPALGVLRALGMEPRRVRAVVRWQQGIIYVTALALGCVIGLALTLVAVPSLVELTFVSFDTSYSGLSLDNGLPVRLILAVPQLALALAALAAICALALLLSARVAARPLLSEALRLNED